MECRNDMASQRSSVTQTFLDTFVARYGETVGYTVTPGDTVLVTPGKRKNDVAPSDLGGPSHRKIIFARKPPLGGPGLKPKTSGTPPPATAGRVYTSTDSDSTSSASSDSSFSPSQTEGGSGAGRGVSKSPGRSSSPEASPDVEVNPSDQFVPDWKLTNERMKEVVSTEAVFQQSPWVDISNTDQANIDGTLSKGQSAQLVKDMEIKNRQAQTVMQDDLNKKVKVIENMTKDRESDHARISVLKSNVAHSFEKVRNSDEFLDMLAGINSLADAVGFNAGLKEGVRLGKIGKGPGDDPKYNPSALYKLKELSDDFDDATFPAMATISSMHGVSLLEIQEFLKDPARSGPLSSFQLHLFFLFLCFLHVWTWMFDEL
ncbi:hypothetical protein E3N88_32785 [Mikania micrantha]|uniref:Uncharacterized protein n=1 Tax=Mikania micrantha TaxID=192012 RepID=A0A5N6M9D0_9ASTR|nr:hypothetical protein E3N88_32785 [Mikania micrantha]